MKSWVQWFVAGVCFLWPVLAFPSIPMGNAPADIKFRNIDHPKLKKVGQIWDISEDKQGFLWVSGARGAARFDGLNVKLFQHDINDDDSIPEGYIPDILHSKNGRVWLGTSKGLFEYLPSTEAFSKVMTVSSDGAEPGIIWSLAEDSDGSIWLGTDTGGFGRFDPDTQEYTRFINSEPESGTDEFHNAYAILIDRSNNVWSGNEKGLLHYEQKNNVYNRYVHEPGNRRSITPGTVMSLTEDHEGNIWVGTSDGLSRIDPRTGIAQQYYYDPFNPNSIGGNQVGKISLDETNRIWIAVDGGGLNLYLPETDSFKRYGARFGQLGTIKNNSVRRTFISKNGDLWLGYHPYGIAVIDRYGSAFKTYTNIPSDQNSISSNTIYALFQSSERDLWVGSEAGVNHIDLTTEDVTRYPHIPGEPNSLSAHAVLTVAYDSSGRLWAGTWSGGLNLYDPKKGKYQHFLNDPANDASLPSNNVWIVKEKDEHSMWVGTSAGLSILHIEKGIFEKHKSLTSRTGIMKDLDAEHIIVVDDVRMSILNKKTLEVSPGNPEWESLPKIINVHTSPNGDIWINTEKGFKRQRGLDAQIEHFDNAGDSAKQYYSQMVTDNKGLLWLGNGNGITSYDLKNNVFSLYNASHGLPGDSFRSLRAAILLHDGKIAMAGADGIAVFQPDSVKQVSNLVKPILVGLKVLDQRVDVGTENSPLNESLNMAEQITLNYEQNVFSIEYSALDYQLANLNKFKIRLRGFDPGWRSVGEQRVATYTNLDPGLYTFEVMSANDQGMWSQDIASVNILVLSPWWKTPWAYAGYLIIAVLLVCLVLYGLWLNSQRSHERRVNNKLKEVDRLKDEFMAKTSHELRTPLNGIIGLTEAIIAGSSGPVSQTVSEKLQVVVSSGRRLSNIINDILDFSKLRNHAIILNISAIDMHDLVEAVMVLSKPLVGNKKIALENHIDKNSPPLKADEQRLTQVLFNLVGNAIKFTQAGSVTVSNEIRDGSYFVFVKDSGIGIKSEDKDRIFQPFEQSLEQGGGNHFGTGLGLAVSKQLIELHGGFIDLKSAPGEGATFFFSIPMSESSVLEAKKHIALEGHQVERPSSRQELEVEAAPLKIHGEKFKILIVDDEPVNRLVLQGFLGFDNFDISEAGNGREALEFISNGPRFDLVLLDVMMPGMSGYDACEKIRETFGLCELPIIFLTAKSQVKDMQRGYEVGANDFIYKPVAREEFLAKVHMQLQLYAEIRSID